MFRLKLFEILITHFNIFFYHKSIADFELIRSLFWFLCLNFFLGVKSYMY